MSEKVVDVEGQSEVPVSFEERLSALEKEVKRISKTVEELESAVYDSDDNLSVSQLRDFLDSLLNRNLRTY